VAAINHLTNARKSLDALEDLLREAAAKKMQADQFVEASIVHLREARQIIDSMGDEEGTE
jgi:hypothetical protein